jgi:hypothetical protein
MHLFLLFARFHCIGESTRFRPLPILNNPLCISDKAEKSQIGLVAIQEMTGGLAALCSSLASAANRIHDCLRGTNRSTEWVFRKLRLLLETGGGSRRLDIQDLKRMGARLCLRRSLMLPRVPMSIVVAWRRRITATIYLEMP